MEIIMILAFIGYMHGFGGAEKQMVQLANAMQEIGHDVSFISMCDNNECFPINESIHRYFIKDSGNGVKKIVCRYFGLKKCLGIIRPDIVVNFWFQSAYFTAFMKKKIRGKVIYAERGDPGDREYYGLLGIIRRLSLYRIDGFVFQSKGAKNYFDDKVQKKSIVIHNPCFINKIENSRYNSNSKKIISVGRLHEQKNQKLLIDAFNKAKPYMQDVELHIFGDGELKKELMEQIETNALDNSVFLRGTTKNIYEEMKKAVIFVLSSDYEGLPNVLIEAMALGIPCISTDCKPGGAREIINNGNDGVIVSCNDCDELSKAIVDLYIDSKKRKQFSQKCPAIVDRFSPSVIYSKWNDFFEKLGKV